jgi:hypothetical protein
MLTCLGDRAYYFDEYISSEMLLFNSCNLRTILHFTEEDSRFYCMSLVSYM